MNFGQVKDAVREHFGRIGWPTSQLNIALDSARRDLEKQSNGGFYWMRSTKSGSFTAAQQAYSITTSTSNGWNLPNFKDVRAIRVKESTSTVWSDVSVGEVTQEEAETMFPTDEDDLPVVAIIDNTTIRFFPIPDTTYNYKMWHFEWTTNPTTNTGTTGTDELTERFPEALIYGALVWGSDHHERIPGDADRWRALFEAEIVKIKRHDLERGRQDRLGWEPMTGAYARRGRTQLSRGLYV